MNPTGMPVERGDVHAGLYVPRTVMLKTRSACWDLPAERDFGGEPLNIVRGRPERRGRGLMVGIGRAWRRAGRSGRLLAP